MEPTVLLLNISQEAESYRMPEQDGFSETFSLEVTTGSSLTLSSLVFPGLTFFFFFPQD